MCWQAGILDVEAWIAQEGVGRILDFWEAYDRVQALPDSWQQTATTCQQLSLLTSVVAAGNGSEMPVQPFSDFMPPRWVPPKPQPKHVPTDEEVADRLDRQFRVKRG